jgi:hypothetical protein
LSDDAQRKIDDDPQAANPPRFFVNFRIGGRNWLNGIHGPLQDYSCCPNVQQEGSGELFRTRQFDS